MLDIALILAERDDTYEDMASKFLEHLIYIMDAINNVGQGGGSKHFALSSQNYSTNIFINLS